MAKRNKTRKAVDPNEVASTLREAAQALERGAELDPQIAALERDLLTKAQAFDSAPSAALVDSMTKAEIAKMEAGVDPADLITRERLSKGSREAQAEYLRKMSPGAAAAWEAGRAA